MDPVDYFDQVHIGVTWDTLRLGFEGIDGFGRQIEARPIERYANRRITDGTASSAEAAELSVAASADDESIAGDLREVAKTDSDGQEREARKWRLYLTQRMLAALPQEPVAGLREMTDFWLNFDFPRDGPHIVQGRDSPMSPEVYYTPKTYTELRRRHAAWVEAEAARLRGR